MNRVHLYVSGLVQGVFFRVSTRQKAKALNISGYVQNISDGRVEIVAEGRVQDIESFVSWCRKGPSEAEVTSLQIQHQPVSNRFIDFEIH